MTMFKKANRGFTLIELLVVIAIIGILSSVVLASLNDARQKSRDAKRIADVKQLQLALELYFDSNGSYPANLDALAEGGFIPAIPADPGTYSYFYEVATSPTDYVLRAQLENYHSVLESDTNDPTPPADLTTVCTDGTAAPYNYCVKP